MGNCSVKKQNKPIQLNKMMPPMGYLLEKEREFNAQFFAEIQSKQTIVVFGATGQQGGGVVKALKKYTNHRVRAVSRNPEKYSGPADEVVYGDINSPETLVDALKNSYGVFAVTQFAPGCDEFRQAENMVLAAKTVGVRHFVWSTLPNVMAISSGHCDVPHFTHKALANDLVVAAGFDCYTFVQAPFYFQNLSGVLAPQVAADGSKSWTLPIRPSAKIHMGDIDEFGSLVAAVFKAPLATNKQTLSFAPENLSFDEIVALYKELGVGVKYNQVTKEVYSTFFPGAKELANMFGYFEEYTYMGPNSVLSITHAQRLMPEPASSLKTFLLRTLNQ